MSIINLHGRNFSPLRNSEGGRVTSAAVFSFTQTGTRFVATYSGEGFIDGHLIGKMTGPTNAVLIYHCRADNGELEAGQATASFAYNSDKTLEITMQWQWLNGTKASGISVYGEII
jgi:hypothetical protein